MSRVRLTVTLSLLLLIGTGLRAVAQASALDSLHNTAVRLIRDVGGSKLPPGDTLLVWNPDPGGLFQTVQVRDSSVVSSLLRHDGLLGTSSVSWSNGFPSSFRIQWSNLTARSDTGRLIAGRRRGRMIELEGGRTLRVPTGEWLIMDFGMEEQAIGLALHSARTGTRQLVSVLRPWHMRWDTLTILVRDTLDLRILDLADASGYRELVFITAQNRLLWSKRLDDDAERRPLEGSSLYAEFRRQYDVLRTVAASRRSSPR